MYRVLDIYARSFYTYYLVDGWFPPYLSLLNLVLIPVLPAS